MYSRNLLQTFNNLRKLWSYQQLVDHSNAIWLRIVSMLEKMYFNEKILTNILSMGELEKIHQITYDNKKYIFWVEVSPSQSIPFHC
jgi:hypothetical protein